MFHGVFAHSLFGLLTSHLDHASQLVFCRASSAYFRYWKTVYLPNLCNNLVHPEEKFVLMLQLIALNEWKIVYHVILGGSLLDLSFTIDTPLYSGIEEDHLVIREHDFPFNQSILEDFTRFSQLCDKALLSRTQLRLSWPHLRDYKASKHQLVSDTLAAPFIHAGYSYPLSSKRGFWTQKGRDLIKRRFPHLTKPLRAFPTTANDFEAFCIASGALRSLHVFSPVPFCSENNIASVLLAYNTNPESPGWLSTICTSFYYDVTTTVTSLRFYGKQFYTEALKLILPRLKKPFLQFDLCSRLNFMTDGEILVQRGRSVINQTTETLSHFFGLFLASHLVCRRSGKCDPIYCASDESNGLVINWIVHQAVMSLHIPETFHANLMDEVCRVLEDRCTDECFIEAFKIVQPLLQICAADLHAKQLRITSNYALHEEITIEVIKVIDRLEPTFFTMTNPLDAQSFRDVGLSQHFSSTEYHRRLLICAEKFKYEPAGLNYFMVIWHIALKYYVCSSLSPIGGLAMLICKNLFYDTGKDWIDLEAMNDLFPQWQKKWTEGFNNCLSMMFFAPNYKKWCVKQYNHISNTTLKNSKRKREISNC